MMPCPTHVPFWHTLTTSSATTRHNLPQLSFLCQQTPTVHSCTELRVFYSVLCIRTTYLMALYRPVEQEQVAQAFASTEYRVMNRDRQSGEERKKERREPVDGRGRCIGRIQGYRLQNANYMKFYLILLVIFHLFYLKNFWLSVMFNICSAFSANCYTIVFLSYCFASYLC